MLFWNGKVRKPDNIPELVRSPYSVLKPTGYSIPEKMIAEIEKEAIQIGKDAISSHLIDEFSVEEMQVENGEEAHFIDKMLNHMFIKPLNELKRQKVVMEKEKIPDIKMLQKAELYKQKSLLEFAKSCQK